MLVHDPASGNAWSIEFPPRAPLNARPGMFEPTGAGAETGLLGVGAVRGDANATGWLAPCVPGVVAGLCLAQGRFGTVPLARLLDPAIALADDGFEFDSYLTLEALEHLRSLRANPECARIFLRRGLPPIPPVAVALSESPRLRQRDLARTLRAVAAEGADAFYRGEVADAIHTAFERFGGVLTRDDLEAYQATIERPLRGSYRGWSVLGPRAPSGGWTAIQALQIMDRRAPDLHALAEALQLAFADRYRVAGDGCDPEALLSDPRTDELADTIRSNGKSPLTEGIPSAPWSTDYGHGTTQLCAVDADGRMVSCTLTAGNTFGAKVIARDTGVLFDSGMAWFDPRSGAANSIAGGRRPLVNMAPLLLVRGGNRVGLGAAGGRRIISAVTQVASGIIDRGMPVQEAISAPRLDASDRILRLSNRFAAHVAEGLRALGHDVLEVSEEDLPFPYEFARPAAAAVDDQDIRSGGIQPYAQGFVAGI
jgi:gamma-glutamyltranspeptidase/glutathione hydrolase